MAKHDPFRRQPQKFPVRLDEFCRLVIGGKSRGERLRLFRAYVRDNLKATRMIERKPELSEDELIDAVEKIVVREQTEGMAEFWFTALRQQFCEWRKNRRKEKALKAASARWKKSKLTS